MSDNSLKILVLGAGAIGTYIGGSLAAHNNLVWFFDRPESVERLRKSGIKIIQPDKTVNFIENPNVSADLGEILRDIVFDCGIIAVKSYDTESLINQLCQVKVKLPPLVCFQNGVENEELIRKKLENSFVFAGTVTTAIGRSGNNEIIVEKLRGIGIEKNGPLSEKLTNALNIAGLHAKIYENAHDMKWSKLLTNLTSNALSAILGMPPSETMTNMSLYKLEIEQFRETLQVMKSYGFHIVNLPGTPVKPFAWIVKNLPPMISQKILNNFIIKGRGKKMPSFLLDLENGRGKSEVYYLNGAIYKYNKKNNIKTPINKFYNEILMGLTEGRIQRSDYQFKPDFLLKQINQ
jgi:2-dehydropantoate 2-reductase